MIDPRLTEDTIDWVRPFFPASLPRGWELVDVVADGAKWLNRKQKFSVILSGSTERDGKRWLHLSCARATYLPTWADLAWVKATWLGPDTYAISVMPPSKFYVNLHPRCLHLWHCLEGYPLPEFSGLIGGLRTL